MKRTGVIIGVTKGSKELWEASGFKEQLEERYPGVVFSIMKDVAGCVAFDFEDGKEEE